MELKQISPTIWELPKSFKNTMNVPARIIGTEKIIAQIEPEVFNQLANTASLPGVIEPVWAMPDAHVGFGVPIGGVFATDPQKQGVISPGSVGFDINCLPKSTKVLHPDGYNIPLKQWLERKERKVLTYDQNPKNEITTAKSSNIFVGLPKKVYQIETELGWKIKASEDHPILTSDGMKTTSEIDKKDMVAVHPFKGVKWEKPKEFLIIKEIDIQKATPSFLNTKAIIKELKKRNLVPLKSTSNLIPAICRLAGYITGDGNITLTRKTNTTACWGDREDLKEIKQDFKRLGFSSSIHTRKREHKFKKASFKFEEVTVKNSAKSLAVYLKALEIPTGNKAHKSFAIPEWLLKMPKWSQRLYLASFFGAEMTAPSTLNGINFYEPTVSINKHVDIKENGINFLNGIKKLLKNFKIKTRRIAEVDKYSGKKDKTIRLRLQIAGNSNNLIKLFEKIGFGYCEKRKLLSLAAIVYLKKKRAEIKKRKRASRLAKELYTENGAQVLYNQKLRKIVNKRFIERSIWGNRKAKPRPSVNFPRFETFIQQNSKSFKSGIWWDRVRNKQIIKNFKETLYDITVDHKSHNFIADNFVVSNCGVRLIATNLVEKEIRQKLPQLIENLYKIAGAGLGEESKLTLTTKEIKQVLKKGSRWAVENGYGKSEDLKHTENNGQMQPANPDTLSDKAIKRGKPQLGTLGSGNHFLEVQKLIKIFDQSKAKELGINKVNQITVMIHCGSRGLGHQVATDYSKEFKSVMKKYNISIPDSHLACVPFNSPEGQKYFKAMNCAANYAFANRQLIMHKARKVFGKVFQTKPDKLGLNLVYGVTHNMAKLEVKSEKFPGHASGLPRAGKVKSNKKKEKKKELLVHRKGATRAFENQPVIIGGSMETSSYLLLGTKKAEELTFGSTAHGAGRRMSRTQAKKEIHGKDLQQKMKDKGIYVKTASFASLAEEGGYAYKDINEVIKAVDETGISKPIAQFKPIGNIKG